MNGERGMVKDYGRASVPSRNSQEGWEILCVSVFGFASVSLPPVDVAAALRLTDLNHHVGTFQKQF